MKIAIVGSRNYPDLNAVMAYVNSLPKDTIVVSGGAKGVDSVAEYTARMRGLQVEIYKPDWDKYGKSAGFRRNADIVNAADHLTAFWYNMSKGTANSIELADKRGIPTTIYVTNPMMEKSKIWEKP